MEASLPISAATEQPRARATAAARPAATAPSISLPLRFMAVGMLALFVGVGWLLARPSLLATYHYNQYVIAFTHLIVLGWICSFLMGAMYQLVPVALETPLHSERLARWQFPLHAAGFAGMVWMFHAWNMQQVGHFGSILAAGAALFVYNIARTLLRVPKWNVTATAVASALAWFSLTIGAGLFIAAGKCSYDSLSTPSAATSIWTPLIAGLQSMATFARRFNTISAMHAHAHIGIVGFFVMTLVGVSYKLVPMFTLSDLQNKRRATASVVLLNAGLAGSFITVLLDSPWKPAFALLAVIGLALYGVEIVAILRARKRRDLDWGMKYFLTALAFLVPACVLALVLSWPGLPLTAFTGQLENVYGFLGLIGVVSFSIIGMLYKILPFLAWFGTYSRHLGRARVPALADMYSTPLQIAGYWLFLSGLLVTATATAFANPAAVRAGCTLLALATATLAINVCSILLHCARPRLSPLAQNT